MTRRTEIRVSIGLVLATAIVIAAMWAARPIEMTVGVRVLWAKLHGHDLQPEKLAAGMTYRQVSEIIGTGTRVPDQPADHELYEWSFPSGRLFVLFFKGTLIDVKRADHPCHLPCVVT